MPERTSVAPTSSPATWQTATVRLYLSVVTRRHSTGRSGDDRRERAARLLAGGPAVAVLPELRRIDAIQAN